LRKRRGARAALHHAREHAARVARQAVRDNTPVVDDDGGAGVDEGRYLSKACCDMAMSTVGVSM